MCKHLTVLSGHVLKYITENDLDKFAQTEQRKPQPSCLLQNCHKPLHLIGAGNGTGSSEEQ